MLSKLALPLLRRIDPETAHGLTLWALKRGFGPASPQNNDPALENTLWGLTFPNPIGVAAGFDKNADVFAQMLAMGFGFTEIGTVTPRPQAGNPRPRLFRLTEDRAVINRMGFNNEGVDAAAARLKSRGPGIVGSNIGKNKDSDDAEADYVIGAAKLAPLSDYMVINVSSPNTPGLRALQDADVLARLVRAVRSAAEGACNGKPPPLLVKIAPDLTDSDKKDIAAVASAEPVDGLIISNTTIERPDTLRDPQQSETGGLSGAPLFEPSTKLLREMYGLTGGGIPLIGVGGISDGHEAYTKIRAGASLVQLYSGMVYAGPDLIDVMKSQLCARLAADGFKNVAEAIGADAK